MAYTTLKCLKEVREERHRQDIRFGLQNHTAHVWMGILMEEVGELAQAVNDTKFGGKEAGLDRMKEEAIQVAAVAVAFIERIERRRKFNEENAA